RVRHLPHLDSVPGDAALPADGGRGALAPQELEPLRHGARRLPAAPHVTGGARRRLRLALRAALFACVDLETPPGGSARRARVPGDVVPLQALEQVLAFSHPTRAHVYRVASARRAVTPPPPRVPRRARRSPHPAARSAPFARRRVGGRLNESWTHFGS